MNPDPKTTEYLEKMAAIKLSDSSRTRIGNNLLEYARFHTAIPSVRVDEVSRSIEQVPQRTAFLSQFLNVHPKSMTAALLAIMLVIGGGTSYAAESAVPGDLLYTVKTDINENVQSVFALSNESKAELQVSLAEERLAEAETLAARGELSADASTNLSSRLRAHLDAAETNSQNAQADGDFESSATVRASIEGNLRAHATILADLNGRVAGNNGTSLLTAIGTYVGMSVEAQTVATATIETSVDAKAATAATIKSADHMLAAVQDKVSKSEAKLSAEVKAHAKTKLATAVTAESNAQAAFEAGSYSTAYAHSQTAIRLASEVDTMISSTLRLPVINSGTQADNELDSSTHTNDSTQSTFVGSTTSTTGTSSNGSIDTKVDTHTDTSLENDMIDGTVKTGGSLKTGLDL